MFIGYIKILKGNIMKFAHLADTHLGYRQFGLLEREKDFYEVFDKIIDKILLIFINFLLSRNPTTRFIKISMIF